MAVASNLTDISMCESTTNWSVSGGPTLDVFDASDDVDVLEGTYVIGGDVDIETGLYLFDVYADNSNVYQNYTGRHLHVWLNCATAGFLDIKANGGIQLAIEDDSNNIGYWDVAGSDTYFGGWKKFIVDCDSTPTSNNGTDPDITSVAQVGAAFTGVSKSKLPENCFIDCVQWGSSTSHALAITGGTSGTPLTWDDIFTADQALAKPTGVIEKFGGVYYLQGGLLFGNAISGNCYFEDEGQTIVWGDTLSSSAQYKITIAGNASGTTSFVLGNVTGSGDSRFGYSGGSIMSAGAHAWSFDAENYFGNIDECFLYGCNFRNSGTLQFKDNTDTQAIISCTFDDCGMVQPNEALVLGSFFLNTTSSVNGAVEMLNSDDDNIRYCTFKNVYNAIYFPSGQTATRDFVGLDIDATYDIYNDSGSTVTINADTNTTVDETENPSGSSVTVVNTKTLTVSVEDENGDGVNTAQVRIEKDPGRELVSSGVTSGGSTGTPATYVDSSYNYLSDQAVFVKVRKSSTGTRYLPVSAKATILSTGLSIKVTLREDIIVA